MVTLIKEIVMAESTKELQRLRARRQGTGRNYKNRPRQTKTVDPDLPNRVVK